MTSKGTLLITGASGFVGRNLSIHLEPLFSKIILCSRNISEDSFDHSVNSKYLFARMDINEADKIEKLFAENKPDYVIHSAGIRDIRYAETHPMECLQTNINGSVHIAKAAIKNECKAVIGISSTRAAMPVSGIYGMSKSFMERIFYDFNAQSDVQFMNVRLGNIAWAPSSVLDDWKIMLDATGIIKTTGYNMSRLFLTINETADIMDVIFSNSEKFAGFTVVPDMKTAKIGDILHKFIETFGGQYESLPPLVPEKKDDYLIGQEEISYTKSVRLDNRLFYLVSLVKQDELLANNLDFFQGMKMSDTEIIQMITGSPKKVLSYKI